MGAKNPFTKARKASACSQKKNIFTSCLDVMCFAVGY